ncbi:DNA polymerase III subunit alpha [Rickettsia felis str. Pedreira]|uniref:DNA polymerase III subunit alpha n=3 Tax=Rickettsia felis TaxID=42862 RepID=DPO3A_RICFE|nr:DNA polymerase III subunit alpha [Rickettsia felis]Q4UK40.1 RecName: Full=DNA polymerase III subunit alpha [Rickettsia felis URRWXCal2]AAY62095.1 DNA polymerase III alpha chain [Rickettsia felis URRWXCal2]KHO02611.1 DNA polymerase III subunit alpha [Rickettsia felis]KJV58742.1 DNA polymerase III subunit alpha [Rickettsia felis str. Pedreira]MDE8610673.1 DNA polymerase III subunit alpha [Rickettsia felis]
MRPEFIHLRTQSSYSFLESALTIEKVVELASSNKMPAICLADKGNLFGSLEFALYAVKKGLQPIHGVILNIKYDIDIFAQILLIAKDETGYKNLLKLSSLTFTKNDRKLCDHIDFEDLIEYQEGLIALCCYTDGIVGKCLLARSEEQAMLFARKLQDILGDRFYFEIMRHDLPEEQFIEDSYIRIAAELAIPLVATNKVLFSEKTMHDAHDVLLCISAGVTKEYPDRKTVSENCYFRSPHEMIELFSDLPSAIQNTVNLRERCYFAAHANPPMLPNFATKDISETDLIRKDAKEGLLARLATKFKSENIPLQNQEELKTEYFARLNYELDIICNMNFAGYFLIVSDFIKWSKKEGILVGPGRGSGAGSVVAWSLLITDLDPIKFGLLFERFLNPERISMPDFDIDFCQERREEVINYVRSKYGNNRVGQIITFGKMQAKAVIKDVARVLSLPYKFADYLTELVPFSAVNPVSLEQAMREVPELANAAKGNGLYNLEGEAELIKLVLDTSLILEGLHRHSSTHAAGIVIAGTDLVDIVPVYKDANSDMLVVGYSMKYSEIAGLIKFDFLGLQTLTVITDCKKLLKEQGIEVDFNNMTFDDNKTYQMLCKGKGVGVFQFESIGMKDALRRLKPDSIHDLIALGALYRPGPMENIPTYIACKHKLQQPDYLHELLKPILEETYGVVIYQEQVQRIAQILAGYTLGAADLLRRAMGKKIKKEMEEQEEIFVKGAIANNISESQAKSIFATVAKFAGYGFNKAHAAAYGVISYQTAYLKANYPAEFLVACLNLELNNHDKINLFLQEAKDSGIKIIAPNINISEGYFSVKSVIPQAATCHPQGPLCHPRVGGYPEKVKTVLNHESMKMDSRFCGNDIKGSRNDIEDTGYDKEKSTIIFALGAIKGVTPNFGKLVTDERKARGAFKSITDFIERLPLKSINSKLLENLIKSGCFDELHDNRLQLFSSISKLLAYSASYHAEQESNQFSLIKVSSLSPNILIASDYADNNTLAFYEFESMGLFISNHPLTQYQEIFSRLNILNTADLHNNLPDGTNRVNLAGVIQKKDSRMSARGRFVTLVLSDPENIFELSIFSEEVLKDYVHLLDVKSLVVVNCDIVKDEGGIKLTAKSFSSIEDAINNKQFELQLYPQNHEELRQIVTLLAARTNNRDQSNAKATIYLQSEGVKNFVAKITLPEKFFLQGQDFEILKGYSK